MYKCKILTASFFAKVTKCLEKGQVEKKILYIFWNNPTSLVNYRQLEDYFSELGIRVPMYNEMPFIAQEKEGPPCIRWVGEIKPIKEIAEIFAYRRI